MTRSYNRRQRRNNGMKKKMTVREEAEIKNLVLIIFSLVIVFVLVYALTYFVLEKGLLSRGYTKPTITTPAIDYETATIGTVFDKKDKEYYVAFDYFGDMMKKSVYFDSLLTLYKDKEKKLPMYKVDLSYGVNEKYISDKSNPKANKSEDLKINGLTLIKIKNGKNVLYLDNEDAIAKELGFK